METSHLANLNCIAIPYLKINDIHSIPIANQCGVKIDRWWSMDDNKLFYEKAKIIKSSFIKSESVNLHPKIRLINLYEQLNGGNNIEVEMMMSKIILIECFQFNIFSLFAPEMAW